ncbi:hypothetical protein AMS68_006056 [Peltaster fructicola]|uniref:AB hydrolase-1 domain-containing protein n=1 Tax=Peltaster fructicola TaxID=286661 RepID=A0A6H0Y0Z5_9PEZI|nr:hypothetical protein AMS68_006056 [Peltaster fructicola]
MPLRLASASLLALPASVRSTLFLAALYPIYGQTAAASTSATSTTFDVSRHQYPTMMSQSDPAEEGKPGQKAMLARQRAKEEAAASGQNVQRGSWFPLGYKDGFSQWWAGLSPAVTEHKVLSFIPHLKQPPTQTQTGAQPPTSSDPMPIDPNKEQTQAVRTESPSDPYGPRQWSSKLVQLSGKNRALNEFSVSKPGQEVENNLVMLHGYGAGLGFFYKNFEPLSRLAGWQLYALDLLGMGRSSRPPFRINAKKREDQTREAESWFIDALEEWRVKRGIDKMTLMGHSLGGYLAVCYALKYPGHLNKLILASPVGIPEDPYAVREDIPDPETSTMGNEFTQSQDDVASSGSKAKKAPPPRKMPRWLVTAWDANISPFSLVRLSGPLGPRLVSGWTSRRFSHLPGPEAQALHDYSYSLFRQKGSGEYALTYVLAPGAFARSPLIRRIQGVGRQLISPSNDRAASLEQKVRETGVPVVMLYGDHDWMDVKGGHDAAKMLNEQHDKNLAAASDQTERLRENGEAKVVIIKNAGHHVYLDGCDQFNNVILDEMKGVERTQKELAALAT